jgi:hypothetical protein
MRCPHCRAEVQADDRGECPACGASFPPPARRARGFRPVRVRPPSDHDPPEDLVNYAKGRCEMPALGLLYTGAGNVLFGLMALVYGAVGWAVPVFQWTTSDFALVIGVALYQLVVGVVTVFAGFRMRRAEVFPLCVAGCVLSATAVNVLWVIGLPLGIFGLITLFRPRVRLGFAANRRDADLDA